MAELHFVSHYKAEKHVAKRIRKRSGVDPEGHYVRQMLRQCLLCASEKIADGQPYVVQFTHGRYEADGIVRLAAEISLWQEIRDSVK